MWQGSPRLYRANRVPTGRIPQFEALADRPLP
jgi:hypothetical protein